MAVAAASSNDRTPCSSYGSCQPPRRQWGERFSAVSEASARAQSGGLFWGFGVPGFRVSYSEERASDRASADPSDQGRLTPILA